MLPPITRLEYYALIATLSWIGGFLPLFLKKRDWTWAQCIGLALVLSPFVRLAIGTAYAVDDLITTTVTGGYVVVPAIPHVELWRMVFTRTRDYLLIPLIGLMLIWQRVDGLPRRGAPTPWREGLARAGLHPREGVARDALNGLALFVFVAVAYITAFVALLAALDDILASTGDESQVFSNMTPILILLVSLVAGVTEEFLFRGILTSWLTRAMPWAAAALLQATWFGFIHAGYSTWAHVLGPFIFGLGMAWVARVLGLVPAVLLHAEVNIVAFGVGQLATFPEVSYLLIALLAANAYALWATRASAVRKLWRSLRSGFAALD